MLSVEPLGNIPYVDRPDIKLPASTSGHEGAQSGESVSMPFRYVKGKDGKGVMPKVSGTSIQRYACVETNLCLGNA